MATAESAFNLQERYRAAMVLSGTGDALGYYNGRWEFCSSGLTIFNEAEEMGGVENIQVKRPNWIVSDDTVMHLATGEALGETSGQPDREKLFSSLASYYKSCMKDMAGRAPGATCMSASHKLQPHLKDGYHIPFNPRGGGCGAAMRAMCIGLRYPRPDDLKDLVAVSVESGRMTHHHPTGYLGSLASALFTALAMQGRAVKEWGRCLLDTLPLALTYIKETGYAVEENKQAWSYFSERWTEYLKERNLVNGTADPVFPTKYGFPERDAFYKKLSFAGWGGSSGHDAPMIAYDALLGAGSNWKELAHRSMFHGGDSDSTGVIAACWYGALYGFQGVPEGNHKFVEYRDRLVKVADTLLDLAMPCYAQGKA
ncbi:protein ADP-ribosylarginine hydrolase-like isoform X1 [Pomacea canaliculata]|uniref:protein ADP-ribosylarginine hydrolase-like isoform X1 n=1 Tax=Pomacea canaliculata TaxID=400727 RepID=UPI000D736B2F|nr:protein ADP-ribosylarginine hydrolase-like isoform X1 [Pomacea canaliculata]